MADTVAVKMVPIPPSETGVSAVISAHNELQVRVSCHASRAPSS